MLRLLAELRLCLAVEIQGKEGTVVMAQQQRTLPGQARASRVWAIGSGMPSAALRSTRAAGRLLVGTGGIRTYPKQRYPEHELHQILAGRKDRFDGWV